MEIEKHEAPGETPLLKFSDQTRSDLRLWVEDHSVLGKGIKLLYLDTDSDYFKLLQEDMKSLLPYLQAFAETGTLEPATESPLQGEEERINAIAKASAKRVLDIIEAQNKRIEALQNLVREWLTTVGENEFQGLQEQTAQLLGEESQP